MQEIVNYMGHPLKDERARWYIKGLRSDTDELISDVFSVKGNISLPYYLANLATEKNSTDKFTKVNADVGTKAEHESSLMMLNGSPAVYFLQNITSTSDSGKDCIGSIYQNGIVTRLKDVLDGINVSTGRTQHGDTDVIIAGGYNSDGEDIGKCLVKYNGEKWTHSVFTNNSGENLDGCNSQMLFKDGKFYHLLCKDKTTNFPILVFNPEDMTIKKISELTINVKFEGQFEANLYEFNDDIYFSVRPSYDSLIRGNKGKCIIGKIDSLENGKVTQYTYVPDGSNRGFFFTYKKGTKQRLFFETTEYDRIRGHIFDVTDLIVDPVLTILYNVNYADALISGNTLYWCASDIKNAPGGSKVVYGQFPYTSDLF
nr:MAG TPA: hypothetical protein [Caudoviricetes sp.]